MSESRNPPLYAPNMEGDDERVPSIITKNEAMIQHHVPVTNEAGIFLYTKDELESFVS